MDKTGRSTRDVLTPISGSADGIPSETHWQVPEWRLPNSRATLDELLASCEATHGYCWNNFIPFIACKNPYRRYSPCYSICLELLRI